MNQMNQNSFLFGAAYYVEYMPYNRIHTDFQMMKKAGFNTIRIAESTWSTLEPTDGVFCFDHIDTMLEAALQAGLSVIIGTPTYAIPSWLAIKCPDILVEGKKERALYGHRQNMDILHPEYLFHCERMIRTLMEHVHNHPSIIGYQLDNETKSYGNYGPFAQSRFKDYLKENFPTLETLNQAFGLSYWSNQVNDWTQLPDIKGSINGSLNGAYKKFLRCLVTEFLEFQQSIVCEYLKPHQFITQNFDYGWRDYSFGLQPEVDQVDAAKTLTIAGFDLYHLSQNRLSGKEISFGGAIARSIKKGNYLILETQAQGNINWLPYEKQLLLQAFSHFSNGADSLLYWNWHSIHNSLESYWMGVLSHDLKENMPYLEICQIGEELKRYGEHLIHLKKQNKAAILLDHNSLVGLQEFPLADGLEYNDIFRWLHDTCYELNIECDVIFSSQIQKTEDLSDYELLMVPCYYSANESVLHLLNEYVKNGGHMVCTFKTSYSDENLKIRHETKPHLLHDSLGVTYQSFTIPDQTSLHLQNGYENTSLQSEALKVNTFMELLIPGEAKVIATYENTGFYHNGAITENHYGKGSTLYLGCYFSTEVLKHLLLQYFQNTSLHMDENRFPIIHKTGINQYHKKIHYYFNYSSKVQPVRLNLHQVTELRSGKFYSQLSEYQLNPWDFIIFEE